MNSPTTCQRIESGSIAIFALVLLITQGHAWWWPLALFLLFDTSMIGYLKNTTWGANLYNIGHTYLVPASLGTVYALLAASGSHIAWLVILACSWAFHIGVDRALGYGLKHSDSFQNTHLGTIGPAKAVTR